MGTSIELKLRTAALATPALTSLLGTSPFRWYDMQEAQNSPYPAITVLLVSAPSQYSNTARLINTRCRVQFTIRDTNAEHARTVENALLTFLDTFDAMNATPGLVSRQANEVINRRQGGNPNPDPLVFWRTVDAYIWNNESI